MRTCSRCRLSKEDDQFHRRGAAGRQSVCKPCRRTDDKQRYTADPGRHYSVRRARVREIARWSFGLKRGRPCTDCGGSYHPAAMQWDHVGDNKVIDVSEMANRGFSQQRILLEIDKCELVCANCHAIRTYDRRVALDPTLAGGL